MAQDKKSFQMYRDQELIIKDCTMEEKGQVFTWIFDYVNDRNPELPTDRYIKNVIDQFKTTFKRDLVKWEETRIKRQLNGSKGGKQKVANLANATLATKKVAKPSKALQAVANVAVTDTVTVTVTDTVNVNDIVIKEKKPRSEEEIHRSFDHLKITVPQYQKLIKLYGSKAVDQKIDSLENMTSNKKYKTIHMTIGGWLKKDAPAVEDAPNKSIELMTWREFSDIKCKFDSWQREHRNGTNKKNPFIVGDEPALAELERTTSLDANPNAWQEMADDQISLGIRHKHNFGY